jgi:hypothetical protein
MTRGFNLVWLVDDNPDAALADLEEKPWSPPEGGFHTQHWYDLRARAEIDLYRRTASETLTRAASGFHALEGSLLLRVQLVRSEADWLRGRLGLAAAEAGDARGLAEAEQRARRLDHEGMPYARVWSLLLRAGVAVLRRRAPDALELLRSAGDQAEDHHLLLCAAAARHRLGTLTGGKEGAGLVARAEAWMAEERVRAPARMFEVVAPGFSPQP